ncbi:DUF1572 family protein [Deinococcus cellulosilyticus]|uniref:DUF1572 domain-containing protein n=1 Tax=Deinococcus cellulosilyticus (strain DSM 18568 / NBRC 106333 / KACC 11606 / 5516J-15) TaxID=1223518 RepID=A0A511N816_DEIC1|nr:DUF1572 family protein [Deinococcus cellulosilyticus]GEM48571.1 hypothetical protein DC3_42060 [Deinococcus cellulosilyticus NBRC 106333 = KACC 11606]
MDRLTEHYLQTTHKVFTTYRALAEKALAQVSDEEFFQTIDSESNSLALIVKHLAGNMRSRWTNYLTEDGEKPDRNRDGEFIIDGDTRASLMAAWEQGWTLAFEGLQQVPDLHYTIKIRGEDHTVLEAIERQLAHAAYHVGQIVFLAKHLKSEQWKTLSIPRNRSEQFNQQMEEKK